VSGRDQQAEHRDERRAGVDPADDVRPPFHDRPVVGKDQREVQRERQESQAADRRNDEREEDLVVSDRDPARISDGRGGADRDDQRKRRRDDHRVEDDGAAIIASQQKDDQADDQEAGRDRHRHRRFEQHTRLAHR